MISLIGFLFLLPFSARKMYTPKETVISYFTPKDTKPKDWSLSFSKYTIIDQIKKKQKIRFTLDSDKITNQKKINVIRNEALKLKFTNDTSSVVLITLTDDITYGEFISILDICLMDEHKRFAAFDDKFVIFGEFPAKIKERSIPSITCGIYSIKELAPKLGFIEQLSKFLKKSNVQEGVLLITGWLLLMLTFFYFQHRKNKKTTPLLSSTP